MDNIAKSSDEAVLDAGKHSDDVAENIARGSTRNIDGGSKTTKQTLLENVQNQKLKNVIDQIYRPGAVTGDGGLADAIRHQLSTGELVGEKIIYKKDGND